MLSRTLRSELRKLVRRLYCFFALFVTGCAAAATAAGLPLQQVADIPLPGNASRLDYQSIDPARGLLFIAHLGESQVIVFDLKRRRVIKTIDNVGAVHGVIAVPQLRKVYASATGTNEVVAIDESTFKIEARIPGGVYPDGIAFDPVNHRLFVSDERGGTDTVIDTRLNRRIATIPLGGEVGNTQYDAVSRHIFANVQTRGELAEIDPKIFRVIRRIRVPDCQGNHGLLIDERRARAFIACEDNATLVWLNMRNMRIVKHWQVGTEPDVLALDPQTLRLYVSSESGTISIFSAEGSVVQIAQAFLAPAAHTVAVDPLTHLLYFPLENINGVPVLRVMRQRR